MSDKWQGQVERIVFGGWGLVRSQVGIVFVDQVCPDEKIEYKIIKKQRGVYWGQVIRLISRHPHRFEADCPYYGRCGGCDFLHMDYPLQQKIKMDILLDCLSRIGKINQPVDQFIPSPPTQYRVRVRLHGSRTGRLGFFYKQSQQVVEINRCLFLPDEVNGFISQWNLYHHSDCLGPVEILFNPGEKECFVFFSGCPDEKELEFLSRFKMVHFAWSGHDGACLTKIEAGGFSYQVKPHTFFQINRFQWDNMLNMVESFLVPVKKIIDLYCGVGFFIPRLLKYATEVVGVESNPTAVPLAQDTFPQVTFFQEEVEKWHFQPADTVVIDPPRNGLPPEVIAHLNERKYPRLIYFSCNPVTLSRDLARLQKGGYQIKNLSLIDLFPGTSHIESVCLLTWS